MEDAKNYMTEAKDIVNKDKRELIMMTSKASVNGAVTGLVLGLMIGYYKNKNIYVTGLVGAIIGGLSTAILVNRK